MSPAIVFKYFQALSEQQKAQIAQLYTLYSDWNQKINVISRKDVDKLYVRHVLHSLAIAKFISFNEGSHILDIGTGGGFPGIPLAILFPDTHFHLLDSTEKKVRVVEEIASAITLQNLKAEHNRAEKTKGKYDFIVSRAVASSKKLFSWIHQKVKQENNHQIQNGLILLKGGDLKEEMQEFGRPYSQTALTDFFEEDFFLTKKIIYIPLTGY